MVVLSRWILLALVLSPLTALLPAQNRLGRSFGTEGKSQFPETTVGLRGLGIADFDSDGDLDVFGLNQGATSYTYYNDSKGNFLRSVVTIRNGLLAYALIAADVNGDKQIDLIVGTVNGGLLAKGQTVLLLNIGSGGFVDATKTHMPKDADVTFGLALGDVDGDGDPDLVLANGALQGSKGQQNRLYLNNGKGVFKDVTKTQMPVDSDNSQVAKMGDIDGDGDLDLLFGNGSLGMAPQGQKNQIYLNNGKGVFTKAGKPWLWTRSEVTNDLLLVDLDGDKDLDLIEANGDWKYGGQNRVYLNLGSKVGFAELAKAMPLESFYSTALASADLDGDGKLDLYVGNYKAPDRLLLGNGRGSFTMPKTSMISEEFNNSNCVQIADLDKDGNLDILSGGFGPVRLILGLGKGRFLETTSGVLAGLTIPLNKALGSADFDGDGYADLVEASKDWADKQNRIRFGDGQGGFVDKTKSHFPKDSYTSEVIATGDVDGDGNVDIAFANLGPNALYLNQGKGRFSDVSSSSLPKNTARSTALVFVDVDKDKDLDLVIANENASNELWLNNGKGVFSLSKTFPKDKDRSLDVVVEDLDGDGDLDLFFANGMHAWPKSIGQQNRIYANDGKGVFTDVTAKRLPVLADASSKVDAADVDGDGDVDLFVANRNVSSLGGRQNHLLLNDGKGRFTDASKGRIPLDVDNTWVAVFADLDLDGDPDLLLQSYSLASTLGKVVFLENDGKGRFSDKTKQRIPDIWGMKGLAEPALVDLDQDEDLDLVFGRTTYKNRFRQIHAPRIARLAQVYDIHVFAETGLGRKSRVVIPLHALGALPRPIKLPVFGSLSLSPTQILLGSPFLVPGHKAFLYRLPLPLQPSLVGLDLHTQTLVLHGDKGQQLRLSNWISDRILR